MACLERARQCVEALGDGVGAHRQVALLRRVGVVAKRRLHVGVCARVGADERAV